MRLIDADSMKADLLTVDPQYGTMIWWCITVLDAQPTIEPERKTGKWIYPYGTTRLVAICSECGSHGSGNFCANCGSYNKGE